MQTKHDWSTISTNLQLKEIPVEDIPRLLLECIQDLNSAREESAGLVLDIESTITWLGEQVEKRTKGE